MSPKFYRYNRYNAFLVSIDIDFIPLQTPLQNHHNRYNLQSCTS